MGSTKTQTQEMPEFQQRFLEETVIPYATNIAEREFTPFEGDRIAGMTPLQQQSLSGFGGLDMGAAGYAQAADVYGGLGGFQAPSAEAASLGAARELEAARLDPAERFSAAQIGPMQQMQGVGVSGSASAPSQISVDQISDRNISQYMSPYIQGVVEAGQADIERQRQMASNTLGAQAEAAGAFGGSRQAVQEGVLAGEALRQAGALSAQQRQRGFETALQSAQFDIGQTQAARALAAEQQMRTEALNMQAREAAAAREQAARAGNMQAANQFAAQQAQLEQQAAMSSQQAANEFARQQAQLEQQAGMTSQQAANEFARQQAQLQQAASLANQQAAMQAAGIRGAGAAGLGATAGQALQSQLAGLGAQMQAGEAGRALSQAELDAQFAEFARQQDFPLTGLNALATAASGIPAGYGTTTTQTGGMGPMLGAIGSAGMGLGPRGFGLF